MDDEATTNEDVPVNVVVLANDSDADLDPLTVIAVSNPANGSAVIEANGTVTYTPDLDYFGTTPSRTRSRTVVAAPPRRP